MGTNFPLSCAIPFVINKIGQSIFNLFKILIAQSIPLVFVPTMIKFILS